jgi:replicative DNA helicase
VADDTLLATSIQESLVTAILFITDDNTRLISRLIDLDWFEDPYRDITARCLEYWTRYNKAPESTHVDDHFAFVLADPNHKQHQLYNRILRGMLSISGSLNTVYLRNRLYEFARRQNLKRAIFEAGTILSQSQSPEDYDKCEAILSRVSNFQADQNELGFVLSDTSRSLSFLDKDPSVSRLPLGIPELDKEGINPGIGELFLFMAPRGRGKSMGLHHIGKVAMNTPGWPVLHITLENSEDATAQRYMQANFNLAKRRENDDITEFDRDDFGRVLGFVRSRNPAQSMAPRDGETYESANQRVRDYLYREIAKFEGQYTEHRLSRLWVKEFPSGDLTFDKLEAFLDQLEIVHRFVPRIILLDYPDLMSYDDRHDPRHAISRLIIKLRGLAKKRSLAMVIVSQTNRAGENAKQVDTEHTAEDISKIATCDYALFYSQTKAEHELGIARLFVGKARNERQWFSVVIAQNYASAQFCVDSVRMGKQKDYFKLVEDLQPAPPHQMAAE